ncbi:MAG: TonB-dependent receptor [Bacteroidales bacterium]|nr:TonB-dependent receptor [Candidatus Minthousia equi]
MCKTQVNQSRIGRSLFMTLLFLLNSTWMFAQSTVTGVVTDNNGEPLIGVNVVEKGTTNGTITGFDGDYTLKVAQGKTLVFSYIGYLAQEVVVKGTKLDVVLQEDAKVLDDVVVIGYGSMARKDITSSITTVKADQLNKGVFTDAASMLQGKVAGLTVTTTGDPNGSPSMTLRGASSLRGGAMSPYYVIDGIPGVDISMVAPDDIESIDVLRDATATAIYGSKAANGVIIVTTKKGKKNQERVNVTYSGYVAFDKALKTLDMASAEDLRGYIKKNNIDYMYDGGASTDWQKEVMRTALSHNHNLSINGGSDKTTYMASINLTKRNGVVTGSNMNRANFRSLMSTKVLKDKLELSAGINAMFGKNVGVPMGDEGASVLDAMNYFNPTLPITKDGDWSHGDGSNNYNPLSLINEDKSETQWKRMQVIGKATLNIMEGLNWNVNYSYNNNQRTYSAYHSHKTQITDKYGNVSPDMNGVAQRSTYFGHAQTFETYGNFDRTFNDIHKVSAMLGYSWEENRTNDGFGVSVHNFFDDQLAWNQLTYAGDIDGVKKVESGTVEVIRNISFYGRVSYSYNSKYMLQATIRRDGSSVFGKDHRWGTFPSVSVAWNITEEDFMKKQNMFDNLKLRLGYGVSGNAMGFGAYSAVATYGATGQYTTINGNQYVMLGATKLANPDLKWESTGMFNVGLDFGMKNGRISGSLEYYIKKTKDLIWDYPVSSYTQPFSSIAANVGEITNRGIEFSLSVIPVQTKNLNWTSTLNISHNKNVVDRLSNEIYKTSTFSQGDPMVAGVSANGWTQRVMEGQPLGTFYTYEFAGYDSDGISTYYVRDENGNRTNETTKDPSFKDRTITGCAQPKLNLGWNNNITYKDWNLSAFITGVFGHDVYNGLRAHYTAPDFFAGGKNVLKEFVTERNPKDTGSNIPSDKFIEKGDYIRLQSLSLGYTFRNFNGWLQSLQLYGTINNVFTITGYKGLDPEVNLGGIDPGVDYRWKTYPHTRTFMIGAKINF